MVSGGGWIDKLFEKKPAARRENSWQSSKSCHVYYLW